MEDGGDGESGVCSRGRKTVWEDNIKTGSATKSRFLASEPWALISNPFAGPG